MNALPLWRKNCGAHSLEALRTRLRQGASIFIIFPEGTRTRSGEMGDFKPGLGRLVAASNVPIVPVYLSGTFAALPPSRSLPRFRKISARIGPALSFAAAPNDRAGWEMIAAQTESAVRTLAERVG